MLERRASTAEDGATKNFHQRAIYSIKKDIFNESETLENAIEIQCAICMESYDASSDVTIGKNCVHIFHTECIITWMCAKHDFCPFCREYFFDVKLFKDVAERQLTPERFNELVRSDDPKLVDMYMGTTPAT